MILSDLSLYNFRNYEQKALHFHERVIGFCGPNGTGKTNLLDAIYYLCLTRTYFGRSDAGNVRFGQQGFRIQGGFRLHNQVFDAVCILRENGKKEMQLNQEVYTKFSHHVGKFPVVVVAPDDISLITGGSEERRKLLDTIVSQIDSEYLAQLIQYNKILQQRNGLLRQFAERRESNHALLSVLDEQLVRPAEFIFNQRSRFLETYLPEVRDMYALIAGQQEVIELVYQSQLQTQDILSLLTATHDKDYYAQRTTSGIHRDELEIRLGDQQFKQVSSQGQRKSLLFALKLAEFNILSRYKGFPPILLLDDVFEKLDEERMHNLLEWACVNNHGQVFLTDTHCSRLKDALIKLNVKAQVEELI